MCFQADLALLMGDDGADAKHKHFNYDKIMEQQNLRKKKRKKLMKKGGDLQVTSTLVSSEHLISHNSVIQCSFLVHC